jgi:hypothetical protein
VIGDLGIARGVFYMRDGVVAAEKAGQARVIKKFTENKFTIDELMNFSVRKVEAGRIALSNWLTLNKFTKLNIQDEQIKKQISSDLLRIAQNIMAAEILVATEKPEFIVLSEKGLSPAAEIFGVCVANGIPVIQYVHSQGISDLVFKRYNYSNRFQHPFSLDVETWDQVKKMEWSIDYETQLMKDFENGYKQGTWFKRKYLHSGKKIKTAEEVKAQLGLNPNKKTAVIFSHVLWDATFFYGTGLFEDYETWLIETVRAACNNPRLNWVVKLHPDLVWKLKYENQTGPLRDASLLKETFQSLPDHVKIVMPDTDIDTYSFFDITDYCLTVRGTIGIEMACRGIPVITAGTGRYSGLGFTLDSNLVSDYLNLLASLENLPALSKETRELARRYAYALFNLRLWKINSFKFEKMSIENTGHPLENNISFEYLKNISEFNAAKDLSDFGDWVLSGKIDFLTKPERMLSLSH